MIATSSAYRVRTLPVELRRRSHSPIRSYDYAPSHLRRLLRWLRRARAWVWRRMLVTTVAVIATGVAIKCHYEERAAKIDMTTYSAFQERNEIYDSGGEYLRALPGPTTRKCLDPEALPPALINALLAVEDKEFFTHDGVNMRGVVRAARHDLATRSLTHGGSSISQQSVKLWLARSDESIWAKIDRKLLEWQLTHRVEREYSKAEILANLLNRLDFGANLHGIVAAAEGFFGKQPKDLSILEAATIVAIIRGPDEYSPIKHPERALARRNLVLRQVSKVYPESLSQIEAQRLSKQPMALALDRWRKTQIPNAISILAQNELEQVVDADALARGGLRVTLTIDSKWNAAVSDSTERHLRSIEARRRPSDAPLQAVVVVIDSKSGAIRVMLPGRPSAGGQLNRVTQSYRDAGSAIKPFTYTFLFEQGANLSDPIEASAIRPGELSIGPRDYSPRNAGGTDGTITLQEALEKSVNTAAVRVGEKLGIETFAASLDRLGVAKNRSVPRSPTSYLGSVGVRPLDLAAGYTIFANHGIRCPDPHIVQSVTDGSGTVIFTFTETGRLAVTAQAADKTAECLRGVMTRGTGRAAAALGLRQPALGKTGTTNDVKDAWFAGATSDVTCVVWVGFDQPKQILNAFAAQLALPLWVRVLNIRPAKEPVTAAIGKP